jgi:hypothetical protein
VSFFNNPEIFMDKLEAYRMRSTKLLAFRAEQGALEEAEDKVREQEKVLLKCELEAFYSPEVLAERKADLHSLRRQISDRRVELLRMTLAAEQRSATIASAGRLYGVLKDKLVAPAYATKAEIYKLLIEKIVLSNDRAEVWLTIPLTPDQSPGTEENPGDDGGRFGLSQEGSAHLLHSRPFVACDAIATTTGRENWPSSCDTAAATVVFTARLRHTRKPRTLRPRVESKASLQTA